MKLFYTTDGHLDAVNDDSGATIAVLRDGVLLPQYDTEEVRAAIADIPLFVTPEPANAVEPDWTSFRQAITLEPAYIRIVGHNETTRAIAPTLVWALGQVEQTPQMLSEVALYWNAIAQAAQPTEAEIEALNEIAQVFDVPLQLNETGLIA